MRGILTYHSIDSSGSPVSVSPGTFRRHVEWLASSDTLLTTPEGLLSVPAHQNAVALTFDDAFANFGSSAWPLLREHELTATLFVPTDHVGTRNRWANPEPGIPDLELLGWEPIARMAEEGLEIGSHSRTHCDMRHLDTPSLSAELIGASEKLQRETGRIPRCFAYPYGYLDERVVAAVAEIHACACGTELRTLREGENPHRLPRLDAFYFQRTGALECWGSLRFRSYVQVRAAARSARSFVRTHLPLP